MAGLEFQYVACWHQQRRVQSAAAKLRGCMKRLAAAPWSRPILRDDPLSLVLLLTFAWLLRPQMAGMEWAIGLLMVAAILLRRGCGAAQASATTRFDCPGRGLVSTHGCLWFCAGSRGLLPRNEGGRKWI